MQWKGCTCSLCSVFSSDMGNKNEALKEGSVEKYEMAIELKKQMHDGIIAL